MSGPNMKMWTGISTRYLKGARVRGSPCCLWDLKTRLGVSQVASLTPNLGLYPWAHQVTFSEESLPKGHGDFILGYYSHNHSILIGVTEPFQVSRPDCWAGGA